MQALRHLMSVLEAALMEWHESGSFTPNLVLEVT